MFEHEFEIEHNFRIKLDTANKCIMSFEYEHGPYQYKIEVLCAICLDYLKLGMTRCGRLKDLGKEPKYNQRKYRYDAISF